MDPRRGVKNGSGGEKKRSRNEPILGGAQGALRVRKRPQGKEKRTHFLESEAIFGGRKGRGEPELTAEGAEDAESRSGESGALECTFFA